MARPPESELTAAAYGMAVDFRDHGRYATREQALQVLSRKRSEGDRRVRLRSIAGGAVSRLLKARCWDALLWKFIWYELR